MQIKPLLHRLITAIAVVICTSAIILSPAIAADNPTSTITASATVSKPIENTVFVIAVVEIPPKIDWVENLTKGTNNNADFLIAIGKLLGSILILAVLFLVLVYFIYILIKDIRKNTIIIEPFEMPEELIKEGYTGKTIAHQLKDKFDYIHEYVTIQQNNFHSLYQDYESVIEANVIKQNSTIFSSLKAKQKVYQPEIQLSNDQQEDIQISAGNFSIKSLKTLIYPMQRVFGRKISIISGEIQKVDNKYKIVARIIVDYDSIIYTSSFIEKKDIQDYLLYAAEELYEKLHKGILVYYLIKVGNEEKAEKVINNILQSSNRGNDYDNILLIAASLKFKHKKYKDAIKYLEKLGL